MPTKSVPLDKWLVVEPLGNDELKPISVHATQQEAELERDRRNAIVGNRLYSACRILEPVAARMGCAVRRER
jgi:hypothetical protein